MPAVPDSEAAFEQQVVVLRTQGRTRRLLRTRARIEAERIGHFPADVELSAGDLVYCPQDGRPLVIEHVTLALNATHGHVCRQVRLRRQFQQRSG